MVRWVVEVKHAGAWLAYIEAGSREAAIGRASELQGHTFLDGTRSRLQARIRKATGGGTSIPGQEGTIE